jgi:hypothetical protein
MVGRWQTRIERDAFAARLEGLSMEDRTRLIADNRAYLNGERDADADFGPTTATLGPAPAPIALPARVPAAPGPAPSTSVSPRPRPTPLPQPPRGKAASYIAHAKRVTDRRLAAEAAAAQKAQAPKKKGTGKAKMTKRRAAEIRREEKKAKEDRAVARATRAIIARADAKKRERDRVAEEGLRGGQAREEALAQLLEKQLRAAEKRKRSPQPTSKVQKKKRATSPHSAADENADDESLSAASDRYVLGAWCIYNLCRYLLSVYTNDVVYTVLQRIFTQRTIRWRSDSVRSRPVARRYPCCIYNMYEGVHTDLYYVSC